MLLLLFVQIFVFSKAEFTFEDVQPFEPELVNLVTKLVKSQKCSIKIVSGNFFKTALSKKFVENIGDVFIPMMFGNELHDITEKEQGTCNLNIVVATSKEFIEKLDFYQKEFHV